MLGIIACTKNEPTPEEAKIKGKIAFYTNAQILMDSDSLKVNIYLDSVLIGSITNSCFNLDKKEFNLSDSILLIEKPVGTYTYYAKTNYKNSILWSGSITVSKDSIQKIFIDAWKYASEMKKVYFKYMGNGNG